MTDADVGDGAHIALAPGKVSTRDAGTESMAGPFVSAQPPSIALARAHPIEYARKTRIRPSW